MTQVPAPFFRFKFPPDAIDYFRQMRASMYAEAKKLPGYPFLPCPICKGAEGCDHSIPERARASHPDF